MNVVFYAISGGEPLTKARRESIPTSLPRFWLLPFQFRAVPPRQVELKIRAAWISPFRSLDGLHSGLPFM